MLPRFLDEKDGEELDVWSEETKYDMVNYHFILVSYGMSFDEAAEFLHNISETFIKEFSN